MAITSFVLECCRQLVSHAHMKRPWPVIAVSILYLMDCFIAAWLFLRGSWTGAFGILFYFVLGMGIWDLKEWARKVAVIWTVIIGTLSTIAYVIAVCRIVQIAFRRPNPWANLNYFLIILGGCISAAGIFLLWAPFIWLRQSSVKQYFR